jgi:exodeoxyribonuclease VII small subunit
MAKASSPAPAAPPSFEAAMTELEGMVTSMEGGQLTLEASLAAYKRGAELLKYCRSVLDDAQQQIRILEGDTLRDFPGADDAE